MERASDFLGPALRRLNDPRAAFAWLASSWPGLVGASVAAHTRPISCKAGLLEITADGKAWGDQMESMKNHLRARINAAWGKPLVQHIRISAPVKSDTPRESDNSYTPFVRNPKKRS
jgi:predicted nucleic acid-binding Zn ribbon protein